MVAEFRLEKPNMSYVNITAANTTTSMVDQQGTNSTTTRNSIRGHILRGGDNTLLTGMLDADPNLRPVVMGGPGMQHDQLEQVLQQRQYYEGNPSPFRPPSSEGMSPIPEGSDAGYPDDRGMSRYNNDTNGSGSMSSPSGDPQYMVGGLPRSASTGSYQTAQSNQNVLTRNFSSVEHMNPSPQGNYNMQSPYGSRVTIIRATETIEFRPDSNILSQQLQARFNGNVHSTHSPQVPPNMSQAGASHLGEDGGGAINRRSNGQRQHRPMMPQEAAGMAARQPTNSYSSGPYGAGFNGTGGDPNMVQALLRSHESLVRENENLKRKLSVLVRTFNDEEKVIKVMKCLEEKKKAARNLR